MIILAKSTIEQTIKIIPRVYETSVTIKLRDDSTNNVVSIILPSASVNGNYLDLSSIFNLTENRFYDLEVYQIKGSYDEFKQRVILSGGTFENSACLLTFLEAENLVKTTDIEIIYKDKIFCTNQDIDQLNNDYYNLNLGEYLDYNGYDNTYLVR
tara:strand:- start:1016 stop:1480 length:465 start_codon:yes stop_codon:yes gene_type:complete